MAKPLCFVIMPFGKKPAGRGKVIDFDYLYFELIRPAIGDAGLEPLRADEEITGGVIHTPMFERLLLCPFAVAEITLPNPNVYYELGVRHATRPFSTVAVFAEGGTLPFDLSIARALPYKLGKDGKVINLIEERSEITKKLVATLEAAGNGSKDSPVFQLMNLEWNSELKSLEHEKTDNFRKLATYSDERKEQLRIARNGGIDAIKEVEADIKASTGNLRDEEFGVVIDLFLSYRSASAWQEMVRVASEMSKPVAQSVMVREQLALALNRQAGVLVKNGELARAKVLREKAIEDLKTLISDRGDSSETNGILGRIYKDLWTEAKAAGDARGALAWLDRAIECYLDGFEADWRDAYPGVNAVTLMEVKNPPDERRKALIPMVQYAVERRIAAKEPDYWDYATRLELAVLTRDQTSADRALTDALPCVREKWEPETTARNLGLIREARNERGENVAWLEEVEEELMKKAKV